MASALGYGLHQVVHCSFMHRAITTGNLEPSGLCTLTFLKTSVLTKALTLGPTST